MATGHAGVGGSGDAIEQLENQDQALEKELWTVQEAIRIVSIGYAIVSGD